MMNDSECAPQTTGLSLLSLSRKTISLVPVGSTRSREWPVPYASYAQNFSM